ncbi:MAG TPA: hypothetical protein V6C52_13420 [Coleofasciculaceae cyanobacterium]|jgi:thiaminase
MSLSRIPLPHPSETDCALYLVAVLLGIAIIATTYHVSVPEPTQDPFQSWLRTYAEEMLNLEVMDRVAAAPRHIF